MIHRVALVHQMSAKGDMTKVAEQVLPHFWDMTDDDLVSHAPPSFHSLIPNQDTRRKATEDLVGKIQTAQEIHKKTQSETKQSPLLRYCMNRLFTGLTSDQFMARESFAVGLAAAFHALPSFQLTDFLNAMNVYLRIKPDIPLENQVDSCIGRVLAYCVCFQLGFHRQQGLNGISTIINGIFQMYSVGILRELCSVNLTEILMDCNEDILQELFNDCSPLRSLCKTPIDKASPEDLFICLTLWHSIPADLFEESTVLPVQQKPATKQWFTTIDQRCSEIADLFFEPNRLKLMYSLLEKTSSSHPRIHILWEILIPLLLCDVDKYSFHECSRLKNFWKLVIGGLSKRDNQQKYLGLSLSLRIMQRVNAGHIPYIIRGPYWEEIINSFHSDQSLLHESSIACMNQIIELVKQAPREKIDCFLPMLICRIPVNAKCRHLRAELVKIMESGLLDFYVSDLLHCLLGWPDPAKKQNLKITELTDFSPLEILEDLKSALKAHHLSEESIEMILKVLVHLSLTQVNSLRSNADQIVQLVAKSALEINEDLRRQCMSCLMNCCLLADTSQSMKQPELSPLCAALRPISLAQVTLICETQEAEKETKLVIKSLTEALDVLWSRVQGDKAKERQIKSLCDLHCVLQLYYFGESQSVDSMVFKDLLKVIEELNNGCSEETMETLIDIFIGLCTRRTDPYPLRLMLRFTRVAFVCFIPKIQLCDWCVLLESLTRVESYDIEIDEDEIEDNIDSKQEQAFQENKGEDLVSEEEEEEILTEEEELTSEEENLEEMQGFLEAASFPQDPPEWTNQAEIHQQLSEDLNSASVRILWFIETVLKKNPNKEFVLITPVHLWEAMRNQDDIQVKDRFLKAFQTLLKCKPKLESRTPEYFKDRMIQFMKELPSKQETMELVSKIVLFLVSRLMTNVEQCQGCLELVTEMMTIAIQHQFRKSGISVLPKTIHSLLNQNRPISRRIFKPLVEIAMTLKNPRHWIKALDLVHTCLQDKDSETLRKVIGMSNVEELLLEIVQSLPSCPVRIHTDLILLLSRVVRLIQKSMKQNVDEVISKEKFKTVLVKKISTTNSAKMKRKLTELMTLLQTNV
eukprot:g2921.t1